MPGWEPDAAIEDVMSLLGKSDQPMMSEVEAAVPVVARMAHSYTRGRGFLGEEPASDVYAVIVTASARLATNGGQLSQSETIGPYTQDIRGGFNGWSLAEQAVLNRYRTRAM